jgi:hypothetical protein
MRRPFFYYGGIPLFVYNLITSHKVFVITLGFSGCLYGRIEPSQLPKKELSLEFNIANINFNLSGAIDDKKNNWLYSFAMDLPILWSQKSRYDRKML